MTTAILLVAVVGRLHAEGLFFAEADGVEAIGRDPQGDQVLFDRRGAAIAEGEVVFRRAALVAMTLNGDADLGVVAKEIRGLAEGIAGVGANVSLIEVEVSVANLAGKELVERRFRRRRRGGSDSNSGASIGGATWAAGCNCVGGRGGRRDFRRAASAGGLSGKQ